MEKDSNAPSSLTSPLVFRAKTLLSAAPTDVSAIRRLLLSSPAARGTEPAKCRFRAKRAANRDRSFSPASRDFAVGCEVTY